MEKSEVTIWLLVLMLLFNGLSSCRRWREDSKEKLVGGEEAKVERFPSTFYLRSGCAATKIAPDRLLTAAHCVTSTVFKDIKPQFLPEEKLPLNLAQGRVISRDDLSADLQVLVKATRVFPSYWEECQKNCEDESSLPLLAPFPKDLGVIIVELPNAKFEAVPVAEFAPEAPKPGESVRITGFGCEKGANEPDEAFVRLKSQALKLMTGNEPVLLKLTGLQSLEGLIGNYQITPGQAVSGSERELIEENASLCPGDSGGPLFVEGPGSRLLLAGVNSFILNAEDSAQGISAVNFHTRVDVSSARDVAKWLASLPPANVSVLASGRDDPSSQERCRYCRLRFSLQGVFFDRSLPKDEWRILSLVHAALKKSGVRSWVYRDSIELSRSKKSVWVNVKLLPGGVLTRPLEGDKSWTLTADQLKAIFAADGIHLNRVQSYLGDLAKYQSRAR